MDLHNCTAVRDLAYPEHSVRVVELAFDRPLARGETQLIRFRIDFRDAYQPADPVVSPNTKVMVGFVHPAASYVLQVRFDRAALPVRCHQVSQSKPTAAPRRIRTLELDRWNTVHIAVPDPLPGSYGISWKW